MLKRMPVSVFCLFRLCMYVRGDADTTAVNCVTNSGIKDLRFPTIEMHNFCAIPTNAKKEHAHKHSHIHMRIHKQERKKKKKKKPI